MPFKIKAFRIFLGPLKGSNGGSWQRAVWHLIQAASSLRYRWKLWQLMLAALNRQKCCLCLLPNTLASADVATNLGSALQPWYHQWRVFIATMCVTAFALRFQNKAQKKTSRKVTPVCVYIYIYAHTIMKIPYYFPPNWMTGVSNPHRALYSSPRQHQGKQTKKKRGLRIFLFLQGGTFNPRQHREG